MQRRRKGTGLAVGEGASQRRPRHLITCTNSQNRLDGGRKQKRHVFTGATPLTSPSVLSPPLNTPHQLWHEPVKQALLVSFSDHRGASS